MELEHYSPGKPPEDLYRVENELYERVWQRVASPEEKKAYENEMPPNLTAGAFVNIPMATAESPNATSAAPELNAAKEAAKKPANTAAAEAVKETAKEAVKETAKEAVKEAVKETVKGKTKAEAKKGAKGAACFGEASAVYGKELQEAIIDELADCEYYKRMAKKFCKWSSTFLALAADEFRHAKRLSAAYFLISGICMQLQRQEKPEPLPPCQAALRKRFLGEQAGNEQYMRMSEETTDPCLRVLFVQLAEEEWEHAQIVRRLLECSIYP